jgi:chromosome segregation ATPase
LVFISPNYSLHPLLGGEDTDSGESESSLIIQVKVFMSLNYEDEFQLYGAVAQITVVLNELNELMSTDITAAVRGVSASIDAVKKLADLAVKSQNLELREGILNLREQLLEAKDALLDAKQELSACKEENAALKAENTKLRQELEVIPSQANEIVYRDGAYFKNNAEGRPVDGPFCTGCYDNNKKLIRLNQPIMGTRILICPVCESSTSV